MIKQVHFWIKNREYVKTKSDDGRYVVRDGIAYDEAYDPAEFNRQYTEGDLIPEEIDSADKAEAYDILMGVIE